MSQQVAVRSPLSAVFLLHIALEIPVAIQGVYSPESLPFLQLNNTSIVFLKLYASLILGSCIAAFLCFSLPEFLPGKRALAIGLCVYHSICSTVLYQSPRFIPHTFGAIFEQCVPPSPFPLVYGAHDIRNLRLNRYKVTPEIVWGTLHGIVGLLMVVWWQGTVHLAAMARKMQ
ncbi:hypothetical protein CCMSSC00406_0005580 [Pleurotus cornucopiae]|uniref:Uncharacterized protein n=1 Tax=Pleurotus cornucopiae TaxID=5321 RepID=A0ACB7ITS0_PLECO|nr:hypothetical protein CCMSSC00406_0005580 [Pleurotus cornucopiae]